MEKRTPAEAFPPGDFIREELAARGWTQEHLAAKMNRPPKTVGRIINGHSIITRGMALELAAAFGTTAQYWMNLEAAWKLSKPDRKAPRTVGERRNDQ